MTRRSDFTASLPEYHPRWSSDYFSGHLHSAAAVLSNVGGPLDRFPSQSFEIPTSDDSDDQLVAKWLRPAGTEMDEEPDCPLIVLLHGLGGHAESSYMQRTANWLLEHGRDVLLFNFRGAGKSAPLCKNHNNPGRTDDLRDLFRWINQNTQPNIVRCGALAVGFSLGGNILLKFLAEKLETVPVTAAVTVSAPLDLAETSRRLGRIRNLPYRVYLLHKLRQRMLDETGFLSAKEMRRVRWTTSIWEFDKDFTARRNGYDSVEDYYADNSAVPILDDINVPTLLVYALDDPFVPSRVYSDYDWDQHPHLLPAIVAHGGHVGFVGKASEGLWHSRCILHTAENIERLVD